MLDAGELPGRVQKMMGHESLKMVGSPGVAPGYVDLESTRSHGDPPPTTSFYLPLVCNEIKVIRQFE